MGKDHLQTLISLRSAFELDEDWVAVGHVAYLIDRLSGDDEISPSRLFDWGHGASLH